MYFVEVWVAQLAHSSPTASRAVKYPAYPRTQSLPSAMQISRETGEQHVKMPVVTCFAIRGAHVGRSLADPGAVAGRTTALSMFGLPSVICRTNASSRSSCPRTQQSIASQRIPDTLSYPGSNKFQVHPTQARRSGAVFAAPSLSQPPHRDLPTTQI